MRAGLLFQQGGLATCAGHCVAVIYVETEVQGQKWGVNTTRCSRQALLWEFCACGADLLEMCPDYEQLWSEETCRGRTC